MVVGKDGVAWFRKERRMVLSAMPESVARGRWWGERGDIGKDYGE